MNQAMRMTLKGIQRELHIFLISHSSRIILIGDTVHATTGNVLL